MPSKERTPWTGSSAWPLPEIRKEVIEQFVDAPMTVEAILDISMAFKKALIELAIGAELLHHLGYSPGEDKPAGAANHRDGSTRKKVLTDTGAVRLHLPRDRPGDFEPILICLFHH